MLEDRPIAQKALVAAGAFVFVFGSAMAGTGFMLTGGFGYADENNPSVRSPDYGYQYAFAPQPHEDPNSSEATYSEASWTQPSSFDNGAPLEAWTPREARSGQDDVQTVSLRQEEILDAYAADDFADEESGDAFADQSYDTDESYAPVQDEYPESLKTEAGAF
ncbi:hypothetical protein U91I_02342 [alpha proteobacterium U9-1i]|nr:hypothetical protein U91I_02342 [alpha proteobacterium U9-1i]